MRFKKVDGGYILRLERGEELISTLATFMEEEDVGAAALSGLGAVEQAHLGCYERASKGYAERRMEGDLEVVGLTGTLSWFDGKPFPHVHLMLTDTDFRATGGHCFAARVSATIELNVRVSDGRIDRQIDEDIGLHLMDLPERCGPGGSAS